MDIPAVDLHPINDPLIPQYLTDIEQILRSGNFILGPYTKKLEAQLQDYFQLKHALGVTSGTDALLLALMALDVRAGDYVIVPNYSFIATANVILRMGAKPIFIDIEAPAHKHNYQTCPHQLENALEQLRVVDELKKVKAIILVELYGYAPNITKIKEISEQYQIPIIEDLAQGLGTTHNGELCGRFGEITCLSFYPTKNVGACGDAGAVVTNNTQLYEKMVALRNHGQTATYSATLIGGNFRISEIQAAILCTKMEHIEEYLLERRVIAQTYHQLLESIEVPEAKCEGDVCTLPDPDTKGLYRPHLDDAQSWNQYVVCFNSPELRDRVRAALTAAKIGSAIYYPLPLNRQKIFEEFSNDDTTVADHVAKTILALPIWPGITKEQISKVCQVIIDTCSS